MRDIYIAIMVAAAKRKSMVLSVDEVADLARDEAIRAAALNGLDESEWPPGSCSAPDWTKIRPGRTAANLMCIEPDRRT